MDEPEQVLLSKPKGILLKIAEQKWKISSW